MQVWGEAEEQSHSYTSLLAKCAMREMCIRCFFLLLLLGHFTADCPDQSTLTACHARDGFVVEFCWPLVLQLPLAGIYVAESDMTSKPPRLSLFMYGCKEKTAPRQKSVSAFAHLGL